MQMVFEVWVNVVEFLLVDVNSGVAPGHVARQGELHDMANEGVSKVLLYPMWQVPKSRNLSFSRIVLVFPWE